MFETLNGRKRFMLRRRRYQSSVSSSRRPVAGRVAIALLASTVLLQSSHALRAQVAQAFQPQATQTARTLQRWEQVRQVVPANYDLERYPLTAKHARHWRHMLWTTALVEPREPFVARSLAQLLALMRQANLSEAQQQVVDLATKTATQLYLSDPTFYADLGQAFRAAIAQSTDPQWVAVSLAALMAAELPTAELQQLGDRVRQRFPNWAANPFLFTTLQDLDQTLNPAPVPPLSDLLNWQAVPGEMQLYVLCRPDRHVLCRLLVKTPDGDFVREPDGQLWSVFLLVRSIHNLNWNFKRGETAQGLYRVEGEIPQPDTEYFRAYGQFPLVKLFMPFEPGVKEFWPGQPGPFRGPLAAYQQRLPATWRQHWGLQQSFWAGKIGRNYFRIHGTGEAPSFFNGRRKHLDAYPWNPTIGCLSALELYDESGQLTNADMPKILAVLRRTGGRNFTGYLVVVELPGPAGQPIALTEVEQAIAPTGPTAQPPAAPRDEPAYNPTTRPLPVSY